MDAELRQRLSEFYRSHPEICQAMIAPAHEGLKRKFIKQADPDGVLDPEELQRRVKELRRAQTSAAGRRSAEVRWGHRRAEQDEAA